MRRVARYLSIFSSFALLAIVIALLLNRQAISDWWALRDYTPPERIVQLADQTTMVDSTRKLFYVNHPSLDDKASFNGHCRTTEQSIVLGCYVAHQGIFLLDVKDPRLNGVIEVTSAHEVLHAAYERLSTNERTRIDRLTEEYFATQTDERIKNTVENYRKSDPSVVPNELHSILGTEVENLPTELESYYARYFSNRKQVVAFSKQYEQAFTDLRNQVSKYDEQLTAMKAQIDASEAEITTKGEALNAERSRMNNLLQAGRTQEYNAAVPGFNQQVNAYNTLVQKARNLVADYNATVEKRNALATEEQELVHAIDSNFTTESKE